MTIKKAVLLLCILFVYVPAAFTQSSEVEAGSARGNGFSVELNLYADAFQVTSKTFDHTDIRVQNSQNVTYTQFPISGKDFWTDSSASASYGGTFFGGSFSLTQDSLSNTGFGKVKAWTRFGFLRLTAGNDIESIYADPLGADPGLRLYTGSEIDSKGVVKFLSENADNITGDDGLLLEAFPGPFTIALAAGDFESLPNFANNVDGTNFYGERYDQKFRYGARAGCELGELGKLNLSYILSGKTASTKYNYRGNSKDIVPTASDAQTWDHQFGLYGSLKLPLNIDMTVGYVGHLTGLLDEFYNGSQGMVKTGLPVVFKNGLNLNARYKTGRLVFRTDNSLSFWSDKNYNMFETGDQRMVDVGPLAAEQADRYALINHFIMWNGFGIDRDFSEQFTAGVYVRNFFANYAASGATPAGKGEYTLFRDQIALELKLLYRFNAWAEAFVKIKATDMLTVRSRDLNAQSKGVFIEYVNNNRSQGIKPTPVETSDNTFILSIPIGITLKFQ